MIAAAEKGRFGTVPLDSSAYKVTSVFPSGKGATIVSSWPSTSVRRAVAIFPEPEILKPGVFCVCDRSCCGEWGKRAYLMERSVSGLPASPTQRYR